MIYLASPYSHPAPRVRDRRFLLTCQALASALHAGYLVFSPVVHGNPLLGFGLPREEGFWTELHRLYLEHCKEFWLLLLDGWEECVGVQGDLALARQLELPIRFVHLKSEEVRETPESAPKITKYFSLERPHDQ
jgi:hypothetical protein